MQQAVVEHEMLWSVWQKGGLFAPDGAALISARDTALVSLDAADVAKFKYSNGEIAFIKMAKNRTPFLPASIAATISR